MSAVSSPPCPGCGRDTSPWSSGALKGHACARCGGLVCSAEEFESWGAGDLGASVSAGEAECRGCESTLEVRSLAGADIERCPDCGLVLVWFEDVAAVAGLEVSLPALQPMDEEDDEQPGADDMERERERELDDGEPDDAYVGDLAWSGLAALLGVVTFGLSAYLFTHTSRRRWK